MNSGNSLPKGQSPGSLQIEFKRCGCPSCRCRTGLLHGPYIYRRWRVGRLQRKAYIAMSELINTLDELDALPASLPVPNEIRKLLKEPRDD